MGATFVMQTGCGFISGFNPRTRDGCDYIRNENGEIFAVSIHAPVMGATVFCGSVGDL